MGISRVNGIDGTGIHGSITVGTTATEAKIGATIVEARQMLTVQHQGNQRMFFGYSSAVTTSTGTELFKDQIATFLIGPKISVWLISNSAGQKVNLTEGE